MNSIAMESLSTTLSGSVTPMCELQAVGDMCLARLRCRCPIKRSETFNV
jgi:hypothetical protein